jgi:NAD(P)H dehydrogenase (quinone)
VKISVILGHPKRGSFNHAIAETVVQALKTGGHEIAFHDLYKEAFDPVLPDVDLPGDGGEGIPVGLLRAKSALIFNTSNTEAKREQDVFGAPLERIWKDCIFGLCSVEHINRRTFGVMVMSTEQQREAWLDEVRETVGRCFF